MQLHWAELAKRSNFFQFAPPLQKAGYGPVMLHTGNNCSLIYLNIASTTKYNMYGVQQKQEYMCCVTADNYFSKHQ